MDSRQKIINIINIIESKLIENWDVFSEDLDEKKQIDIEQIYNEYNPYIRKIAAKIVHNETDIDDIQQEALIKIYKFLRSGGKIEDPKRFIYRITHTSAIDFLRSKRGGRGLKKIIYSDLEEMDPSSETKYDPSKEDSLERNEVISDIRSAIDELPEQHRDAVQMTQLMGMSYPEYASISDKNEQTAKSHAHRGKGQLKKILSKKYSKV